MSDGDDKKRCRGKRRGDNASRSTRAFLGLFISKQHACVLTPTPTPPAHLVFVDPGGHGSDGERGRQAVRAGGHLAQLVNVHQGVHLRVERACVQELERGLEAVVGRLRLRLGIQQQRTYAKEWVRK